MSSNSERVIHLYYAWLRQMLSWKNDIRRRSYGNGTKKALGKAQKVIAEGESLYLGKGFWRDITTGTPH